MISASDNTATDHLFDLIGRDAVGAMLGPMGNDAVDRKMPFLTTGELFVIKWGPDGLADRYRDADESARRALLDGEVVVASLPAVSTVGRRFRSRWRRWSGSLLRERSAERSFGSPPTRPPPGSWP